MKRRTIARIDVFPVGIPMIRGFQFASGSAGQAGQKAPHVFVRLTDSEGVSGWGECRPVPQWSYETMETVIGVLRHHLGPAIEGHDLWDRQGLQQIMQRTIGRGPSMGNPIAKSSIDCAWHDLVSKACGLPLRCFLGGRMESLPISLSWTVTAHSPEGLKEDVAEGKSGGFRHFNFKPGVHPETDRETASILAELIPEGAFFWADANQGLAWPGVVSLADHFSGIGVHVLEQPLPADRIHLMRQLRSMTKLPLAIDESSVSPADLWAYLREGLIDFHVVKITRSGGIGPSVEQIHLAKAAGIPLLVSGLTDGLLTKVAACQLASAYGFSGPAALNGSQFIDEAMVFPKKAAIESRGQVHLNNEPGIGVEPDPNALEELRWK